MPYVENFLIDLIQTEIKDVLTPQLKAMQTTVDSNCYLTILMQVTNDSDMKESASSYYINADTFFEKLEDKIPELLGKEDSCK